MMQITRTTNPTGLRQIDKRHFIVRDKVNESGRVFWIEKFDYVAAKIDADCQLTCIAHAGSTEEYVELGAVSSITQDPHSLGALAADKPLRFRFIFHHAGEPQLTAYVDGVRAMNDAGNLGSSLVDIEPTSLGGVAWKLDLPQGHEAGDKPNVLVEKELFPNALSAANHPWFAVLVMPEVMRQIAIAIADNPGDLDDASTWLHPWAEFLKKLGIDEPVGTDEDEDVKMSWVDCVVDKFTTQEAFKHHMLKAQDQDQTGDLK